MLCNPIQRFNTCCILILHSSTKCCNWNTCTQLQMRWTFRVVVFCSSTKCCNRNSCTGLHMRWMCCTLIFYSSMKCCNKLHQGIMHGIKIPYTRIQHLTKRFSMNTIAHDWWWTCCVLLYSLSNRCIANPANDYTGDEHGGYSYSALRRNVATQTSAGDYVWDERMMYLFSFQTSDVMLFLMVFPV